MTRRRKALAAGALSWLKKQVEERMKRRGKEESEYLIPLIAHCTHGNNRRNLSGTRGLRMTIKVYLPTNATCYQQKQVAGEV